MMELTEMARVGCHEDRMAAVLLTVFYITLSAWFYWPALQKASQNIPEYVAKVTERGTIQAPGRNLSMR